jgi:hypothetical protein
MGQDGWVLLDVRPPNEKDKVRDMCAVSIRSRGFAPHVVLSPDLLILHAS